MNNLAIQFPEPERYEVGSSYYNSSQILITPYTDIRYIPETIAKFGIKLPFDKVVTHTDGVSVCPICKAKIVGYQNKCPAIVEKFKCSPYNYSIDRDHKNPYIGKTIGYGEKITHSAREECGDYLQWDLMDEFNRQVKFFEFINQFVQFGIEYPEQQYSDLVEHKHIEAMRVSRLEKQLFDQQMNLERTMNALKMVVDKMNQAGNCLSF